MPINIDRGIYKRFIPKLPDDVRCLVRECSFLSSLTSADCRILQSLLKDKRINFICSNSGCCFAQRAEFDFHFLCTKTKTKYQNKILFFIFRVEKQKSNIIRLASTGWLTMGASFCFAKALHPVIVHCKKGSNPEAGYQWQRHSQQSSVSASDRHQSLDGKVWFLFSNTKKWKTKNARDFYSIYFIYYTLELSSKLLY